MKICKNIFGILLAALAACFLSISATNADDIGIFGAEGQNFTPAMASFKSRDYKTALQNFQSAYQHNENPAYACYNMAVCYELLGDSARAQQYYQFVIQTFPNTPSATKAATDRKSVV